MINRPRAVAALMVIVAGSGCSSETAEAYEPGPTRDCLSSAGMAVTDGARGDARGSLATFTVRRGTYNVYIYFEENGGDAEELEGEVRESLNLYDSPDRQIYRDRNVVYAADGPEFPDPARQQIAECFET